MFLTRPTRTEMINKQVRFKLNANAASLSILLFLQVLAFFLVVSSTVSFGAGEISVVESSTASHAALTIFWAFFSGISLGSAAKWNEAFTFVSTRLTHHLSSFIYMMVVSFMASLMAILVGPAARLITYMRYEEVMQSTQTITEAPGDFLIQFITAFAYILMVFVMGYTIQSFFQANRLLGGIYIIVIVSFLFTINLMLGIPVVSAIVFAFIQETSLVLFLLKVIGAIILLMSLSIWMTNRLEVRKS